MNIREQLDALEVAARRAGAGSVELDPAAVHQFAKDVRTEIERLERCVSTWLTAEETWTLERERLESLTALQVRESAEFRSLLEDCRARNAGLEEQVRQQRSAKNQARADLVKFTDRMIAAGLMS